MRCAEQPLGIEADCLRQGQQPEGLPRRCTVHDDGVEVAGLGEPAELEEGHDLLGAWQHGELLRLHFGHAASGQYSDQVPTDVRPALFEAAAGVDLGGPQVGHAGYLGGIAVDGNAQHIGNGMGRIGRDQQGPRTAYRAGNCGGRRNGRLPDPALAGVEGDLHPASTLLRSSFSAVSRMTRSALRRRTPIMGTVRSTARV